jgi:hypothetical protein
VREIPRKVAVGLAVSVIVGVLGVFVRQPAVDAIVEGVRGLPGFVAPTGEWIEAHRLVFALLCSAAGAVLALMFAAVIEVRRGARAVLIGGGLTGFFASESVLGWMRGSVSEGPMLLAIVTVMAVVWAIAGVHRVARRKRLRASDAQVSDVVFDRSVDRYLRPPVRIEPHRHEPRWTSELAGLVARAGYERYRREHEAHADAKPVQRRAAG